MTAQLVPAVTGCWGSWSAYPPHSGSFTCSGCQLFVVPAFQRAAVPGRHSSTGAQRTTALLVDVVLPASGERTVAFTGGYFRHAATLAAHGRGVGLGPLPPLRLAAAQPC